MSEQMLVVLCKMIYLKELDKTQTMKRFFTEKIYQIVWASELYRTHCSLLSAESYDSQKTEIKIYKNSWSDLYDDCIKRDNIIHYNHYNLHSFVLKLLDSKNLTEFWNCCNLCYRQRVNYDFVYINWPIYIYILFYI